MTTYFSTPITREPTLAEQIVCLREARRELESRIARLRRQVASNPQQADARARLKDCEAEMERLAAGLARRRSDILSRR